jgi:hypothetical protein
MLSLHRSLAQSSTRRAFSFICSQNLGLGKTISITPSPTRTAPTSIRPSRQSRTLSTSTTRFSDNMSAQDAFREMEANELHKQGQPTAAAAPDQEQQVKEAKEEKKEEAAKVLPKLSAAEFRVYNRMAEHMDMFVRYLHSSAGYVASSCSRNLAANTSHLQAQQLPPNLAPPAQRLHLGQETPRHDPAWLPASGRRVRAPPYHPPHD